MEGLRPTFFSARVKNVWNDMPLIQLIIHLLLILINPLCMLTLLHIWLVFLKHFVYLILSWVTARTVSGNAKVLKSKCTIPVNCFILPFYFRAAAVVSARLYVWLSCLYCHTLAAYLMFSDKLNDDDETNPECSGVARTRKRNTCNNLAAF